MPGTAPQRGRRLAGVSVEYYAKLDAGNRRRLRAGSSTRSPAPCNSTTPSRAPPERPGPYRRRHQRLDAGPVARRASPHPRPSLQWALDAVTAGRRSWATAAWTCSPPTGSPGRSTPPSTPTLAVRPTSPASPSSTPRPPLLPRLGPRGGHLRRHPAHRSRPRPPRQGPHDLVGELSTRSDDFRTRWGATTSATTAAAPRLQPPRRRRPHTRLRRPRHGRRTRPHPHHLHRRTRLTIRGGPRCPARHLDLDLPTPDPAVPNPTSTPERRRPPHLSSSSHQRGDTLPIQANAADHLRPGRMVHRVTSPLDPIARGEEPSRVTRSFAVRLHRPAPPGTLTPSGRPCLSPKAPAWSRPAAARSRTSTWRHHHHAPSATWHWHGAAPDGTQPVHLRSSPATPLPSPTGATRITDDPAHPRPMGGAGRMQTRRLGSSGPAMDPAIRLPGCMA